MSYNPEASDVDVTRGWASCHGCGYAFVSRTATHTVHDCLTVLRERVDALEEATRPKPVGAPTPTGPALYDGLETGEEIAKVRAATGCNYNTARQALRRTGWDVEGAIARIKFRLVRSPVEDPK
jgi:hypothetical protein